MHDQTEQVKTVKKINTLSNKQVSTDGSTAKAARYFFDSDEAVLTLLENGLILNCNKAGAQLLGYEPNQLIWQPISRLLPQLADMALVQDQEINPYLHFLSLVGHRFEVVAANGTHFASELFFSEVEELRRRCLRIVMQPIRQGQPTTLRHLRTY
jgi:PAS domain S-box-containing protein